VPKRPDSLLDPVEHYYSGKVGEHGATPQGADWRDEAGQELRFAQLLRVCEGRGPFGLNDYGCGYGALVGYLGREGYRVSYHGYDISEPMVAAARARYEGQADVSFTSSERDLVPADYAVASGVFNVKLDAEPDAWRDYVLGTLDRLDELSKRGFSFNMLTSYADADRMRPDLYYGDPCFFFDHCKRRYSRHIALLHDYGLWEFTILVRREAAA
jgi:SAM-dependent methyltransferase